MDAENVLLLFSLGTVAALYSSVGHAGASGYIAVFTLVGWSSDAIRPVALVLNSFVALIATIKFFRAGHFRPSLFIAIALFSIPASMVGGYIQITEKVLSKILGSTLLLSSMWLIVKKREPQVATKPSNFAASMVGATIAFIAGLTGTGGGIFLSPLMVYLKWGKLKEISAIAAPYILVNSVAGLLGMSLSGFSLLGEWYLYVISVVVGGLIGSSLGATVLAARTIQVLLSLVLLIASAKLLFV